MKRSTNFSHTRKPRNSLKDIAAFLQDLGYSNEEIVVQMFLDRMSEPAPASDADTTVNEEKKL